MNDNRDDHPSTDPAEHTNSRIMADAVLPDFAAVHLVHRIRALPEKAKSGLSTLRSRPGTLHIGALGCQGIESHYSASGYYMRRAGSVHSTAHGQCCRTTTADERHCGCSF